MAPKTKETEAPKVVTPKAIAEQLGVDPKRVRAFLRGSDFARPSEAKNTSWSLTPEMVEAITERFTQSSDEDEE